jgi:penicillin-binding protein 2
VLTAIAMLEDGVVNAQSSFDDVRNTYRIGSETMKTSHFTGSGIRIIDAISRSSNGYFWHYSTKMGSGRARQGLSECLLPWSRRFGFGERPGLDVSGLQASGRLPRPGRVDDPPELARNVIGQGAMTVSPLQVARFMAAVAARGKLTTPHIASESAGSPVQLEVSDRTWELVHRGMYECVNDGYGTASKSRVLRRIVAAGKTGTAQTGHFWSRDAWARRQAGDKGVQPDIPKPDHAWFAGFAPASKPKYAFVMLAEFSGLPGGDVADCVGEVVEAALKRDGTAKPNTPQVRR